MDIEKITSKQNPKIKNLIHLQKAGERQKQNLFIIEGIKELEKAVVKGYEFDSLFFCQSIVAIEEIMRIFKNMMTGKMFEVSNEVYEKIACREKSGGIIALAKQQTHSLENLNLPENPLILIVESVEKPGNIGALYRTADAAGLDAVIICDPKTDIYNPNAVRASIGCVFTVPTALTTSHEAIIFLKHRNIKIYSTYLQAAIPYHTVDFKKPSAIVMGTEATGISDIWVKASNNNIIIPMRGEADSMNVSTAAAVVIFEACRQREFSW